MKPLRLGRQARDDRRHEVRYYREHAGTSAALKLTSAFHKAFQTLQRHPALGSPALGRELGIPDLRTWLVDGYPLTIWYFERPGTVDVVRIVGQRQDAGRLAGESPEVKP